MSTSRSTKENKQTAGRPDALFQAFYAASRARLEQEIGTFNEQFAKEKHPLLKSFFEDFADLNEGGKLLRGVFVNLGNALALSEQGENSDAEQTAGSDGLALAFEIFQTAVLIHDDIIDHAERRRGKTTVHRRYAGSLDKRGVYDRAGDTPYSAALCIGDAGLYAANSVIAERYDGDPRLGKLITYFDGVVTDTIRGELLDVILPCEIEDPHLAKEEAEELLARSVTEIYRLKTARYSVVGPVHLGMLYGGASEKLMDAVDRFAMEAGVAFQIKDDILGIFADEKKLGKDVGSDIAEAKLTILYQYVRQKDAALHEALMEDYGHSPVTEESLRRVQNIFRESGALSYAEEEMEKCFRNAESVIGEMPLGETEKDILRGLLMYFRGREK